MVVDAVGAAAELDRDPRSARLDVLRLGLRDRFRRREPLDVDSALVHMAIDERALDEVHERRWATDEVLGVSARADEGTHHVGVDEALFDVEMVGDGEATGVALAEALERCSEDDRVPVPVGIENTHPA